MTLLQDVERYIAFRQKLGSKMTTKAGLLTAFTVFAERRGDRHIRIDSALAWSMSASSARQKSIRLHAVRQLAAWLRAEDPCHEMPHRDAASGCRRTFQDKAPVCAASADARTDPQGDGCGAAADKFIEPVHLSLQHRTDGRHRSAPGGSLRAETD